MSKPILHHYPNSPFSEKVRLILGYKGIAWQSVHIPVIMPKPDVMALTGGYRRTPILQVGADVYCDSALIADVLEELAPAPTLYPAASAGTARLLAQWADSTLFWTAIPYSFQPAGMADVFANVPPEVVKAFGEDRKAFRGNAPRMHPADATGALRLYLQNLAAMLADGRPALLGDAVSIADFSVYHCLWQVRRAASLANILDPHPNLLSWMDRIKSMGHGQSEKLYSAAAIEVTRTSTTAPTSAPMLDLHGIALGEQVTVTPADYGRDPVQGELVAATATRYTLRRHDERAGTVHVHFPRIGFELKRVA